MKMSPATEPHFWHESRGGCKVSRITPQQKKKILADPVSHFSHHYPDASEKQLDTLHNLARQYAALGKQHSELQTQTRQLSRLIGKARKNGERIDEHMATMQHRSMHLKNLSGELSATANRILDYFEREADTDSAAGDQPVTRKREYPCKQANYPEVTVSLDEDPQDDWNVYVESNPAASIYHRAEWKALIKEAFGHDSVYFAARNNNGETVGILPLTRLRSRLFGDFMVSMPYFNYGGAVADQPQIEQQLMQAAAEHAAELGVSHIEYRDDTPRAGFPVRTEKVNMILTLPDNHDALWQAFTPKLRAQIRRPQREKVQIFQGGEDCLDDFYSVFTRNMRDLGTPVYPKAFFRQILNNFPAACRIMVLRLDNRPVAAGFLIGHRDTLEIPWASTIRDVNHLSMNMLLYWEVLKYAIDKHYSQFDFGRSSKNSGTYRFKQQWGALPRQLYWHYWLKQGATMPALNPDNPKYALAIKTWRRLPLSMTIWLGPLIVKNLP